MQSSVALLMPPVCEKLGSLSTGSYATPSVRCNVCVSALADDAEGLHFSAFHCLIIRFSKIEPFNHATPHRRTWDSGYMGLRDTCKNSYILHKFTLDSDVSTWLFL